MGSWALGVAAVMQHLLTMPGMGGSHQSVKTLNPKLSRRSTLDCPPTPSRPDERSALYMESLKKGDLLLNRIQKLSKVIDME